MGFERKKNLYVFSYLVIFIVILEGATFAFNNVTNGNVNFLAKMAKDCRE